MLPGPLPQAHEALQILYDSGVAKWERRESEMLKVRYVFTDVTMGRVAFRLLCRSM